MKCVRSFFMVILCVSVLMAVAGCSESKSQETSEAPDSVVSETSESSSKQESKKDTAEMTADELEQILSEQELTVVKTNYLVQDDELKALYPDMLQAIIRNNSDQDIKDAVVAFVAWDENGLPVKIKARFDFSGGAYVQEVNYSDINLVGGAEYGEDKGFSLDEECDNIETIKAIAVSYETFEGETWENPYYQEFRKLYEGTKQK